VRVWVRARSPGLKWHSASASPDADIRAQLAHHFELARHAPEPLQSIGVHVPMRQVPSVKKIVRLRWYDAATELVWNNWFSKDNRTLPVRPPFSAMAWLFGMPGVGKTEWRNFMAIHILRNDDGTGIIVFDRAIGAEDCVVLVRQIRGNDGLLHVQVATSDDSQVVRSTAAAAKRVFHLLDCSLGRHWGYGLGHDPGDYFTVVSSLPHETLLKRANESRKQTMEGGGPYLGTLTLLAPPSTLDELLHLERSYGERRLSDNEVVAIVEKYGPIPRRLFDRRTADDQQEFDRLIAAKVEEWCAIYTRQECTIPTAADIMEHVSDSLVVRRTTFDRPGATAVGQFESAGMEWASNYVRHLIADAMYGRAKEARWGLSIGGATAPDMHGRLAEELMLRLFEEGCGHQTHVEVKHVKGRKTKGLAALQRGITACTVLWMRTGQEKETLAKAIGHVTLTGGPVLIRPFAQRYPGVDALLVVAAGKKATKSILLLAVQATVAATRPLSAGGAVKVELWADLCTSHGIAFDSLVYLLPLDRYKHWGAQDGVPARLPQLAWTL